jgi:hypothetical protein
MNVIDWVAVLSAFAVTGWFVKLVLSKDRDADQHAEDAAREFFEEHGHWPDEAPADARAREVRAAAAERMARQTARRR